jgi:hypothetical protein
MGAERAVLIFLKECYSFPPLARAGLLTSLCQRYISILSTGFGPCFAAGYVCVPGKMRSRYSILSAATYHFLQCSTFVGACRVLSKDLCLWDGRVPRFSRSQVLVVQSVHPVSPIHFTALGCEGTSLSSLRVHEWAWFGRARSIHIFYYICCHEACHHGACSIYVFGRY